MSDKLTAIKIKYPNGTYSEQILLSVLAENVQVNSTTNLSTALDLLNTKTDQIATISTDLDVLEARVDQIVAPTSSTLTLDEEVRDIRVGKDATRTTTVNYTNAGTAVRTQLDEMRASLDDELTDLKSAFANNLNTIGRELYFEEVVSSNSNGLYTIEGGTLSDTGANKAGQGYACRTQFISIPADDLFIFLDAPGYTWKSWSYSSSTGSAATHANTNQNSAISADYPLSVQYVQGDIYIRIAFYRADGAALTTDVTDPTSDYYIIQHSLRIMRCNVKEILESLINNQFGYNGLLHSTTDLDDLFVPGVYRWTASDRPIDMPAEQATMIIFRPSTATTIGTWQLVCTHTSLKLLTRVYTANGFSAWGELSTTGAKTDTNFNEYYSEIVAKSNGKLKPISLTGVMQFDRYVVNNNTIEAQSISNEMGTDYIECPNYLLICFNDTTARLMIYFYDLVNGDYVPRWDLLNFTSSDNVKNYLNAITTRNRTIAIPDGVYMRVCKAVDGDVNLYGWNGKHVGVELSGDSYGIDRDTNTRKHYYGYATTMTIPGDSELWFSKNSALIDLYGISSDGTRTLLSDGDSKRYLQCVKLPAGYSYFYGIVALDYSVAANQTGASSNTHIQAVTNLNDYASTLSRYDKTVMPFGRAKKIVDWAKYIAEIRWTCKHNRYTVGGSASGTAGTFKKDYIYTGIPYTSAWLRKNWFGWHVTRHTFMNAANDSRSIFYNQGDRHGGSMAYGHVCSTYATLCAGWPYPQTTYTFVHDPDVTWHYTNRPEPGEVMVAVSHTIIPEQAGEGDNYDMYTVYEGAAPVTKRRDCWSFRTGSNNSIDYNYVNTFIRSCTRSDAVGYPNAYDIVNYTITNGSARPYIGDRGVYTSEEDILINIYDDNATTLYYQRCTYQDGVFTTTGSVQNMSIDGDQITIDKSTLEDNSFYCVYTDTDSTKEYFEYHVVSPITWTKTNSNLNFSSNDFWYAVWWQTVAQEEAESEGTATEIIPGQINGDYSRFVQVYNLSNTALTAAFRKGTLGAYVVPLAYNG